MNFEQLVELARTAKGSDNWDVATLIRVGGALAGNVNVFANLSGAEKLNLVCQVLKFLLDEAEKKEITAASPNDTEAIQQRFVALQKALKDVIPPAITLAVSAARGKVDLKKIEPSFWVSLCSCFATSAVSYLASKDLISEADAKKAAQTIDVLDDAALDVAKVVEEKKTS